MRAIILPALAALPLVCTSTARADVPRVAADIAPVHSLVGQVMAGVGTPDLVLPPSASPHGYAMRPSEARALQSADLVVWVGRDLTPWLEAPLETLAGDAAHLALLEVEGIVRLGFRDGALFEAHEHGHAGHDGEEHDDDHAAEHDHDHDHDHEHDHDHNAGATDPHAWLDPVNAALWLDAIAAELARLDPENAAAYAANAADARARLEGLQADIATRIGALSGEFVVFHDAYHYFEARFGAEASGSILSDASAPGPARVAEIRDLVAEQGVSCVFVEPQFNRGLVDAVFEGSGVRIGVIDPLGAALTAGPDLYPQMLEGVAAAFEACLAPN